MERWLPVPGYDGAYEVSDAGQVRSWLPWNGTATPRLLKASRDDKGYPRVNLPIGGRQRHFRVHKLVTLAFLGPCPEGQEVRHLDGDAANGCLSNLAYGSHSRNMHDRRTHGTDANLNKDRCPAGHAYDGQNTYRQPGGTGRQCRTCHRHAVRTYKARLHLKETSLA